MKRIRDKYVFPARAAVLALSGMIPVCLAAFCLPQPDFSADTFPAAVSPEGEGVASASGGPISSGRLLEQFSHAIQAAESLPFFFGAEGEYEPSAEKYNLMALSGNAEEQEGEISLWGKFLSLFRKTDLAGSVGTQMYNTLAQRDAAWVSDLYQWLQMSPLQAAQRLGLPASSVCGAYDPGNAAHNPMDPASWAVPQWEKVHYQILNGDGQPTELSSNIREILAMANVYTYFLDWQNTELFRAYAEQLWQASHQYQVSLGAVYYCDGCSELLEPAKTPEETEAAVSPAQQEFTGPADEIARKGEVQAATPSQLLQEESVPTETDVGDSEEKYCPGHVDLTVTVRVTGLEETNNLFALDSLGSQPVRLGDGEGWQGWTEANKASVRALCIQDWNLLYGLNTMPLSVGSPLNSQEIRDFLSVLPEDTSAERRAVIACALNSVGRIPYYYGGKPAGPGYEGNHFAVPARPDQRGRRLSGLDCSGWVNWVYWTALGRQLTAQGTYGLVHAGQAISREELQPGDLMIRLGGDSHVIMFLGWNMDGTMIGIHETAGGVNNVTVGSVTANWPYYRRFLD